MSKKAGVAVVRAIYRYAVVQDLLILMGFLLLTALLTWPWIINLKNAVADEGDPYMIAWTLWWDFHQTFTHPLALFHANIFYPYKYTLAFSEHDYGIALIFFPLFALGMRPLAVHAVATFCGFAFSGYAQFRLTRTLTRSTGAAWIAGIIFAFVPYRFHVLSHLHYLFAGWLPLLLEALVIFARRRTWRSAAYLGIAFTMNALTCTSYFILSLLPLGLSIVFLVGNYRLERDRDFWVRGATALGISSVVLLPFMLPYYFVMKLYGFVRSTDEVAVNSPTYLNWFVAEGRNKLWKGFGGALPNSSHKLFPGMLPILLALFSCVSRGTKNEPDRQQTPVASKRKLLVVLDVIAWLALAAAILATGYQGAGKPVFGVKIYEIVTSGRALFVCAVAVIFRLAVAYPGILRPLPQKNLIESIRSVRSDAFVLGLIWLTCGFLGSLGMNFFLNRMLYDYVPLFRAIRIPSHWAMIAYVGLALLAGIGTLRLAEGLQRRQRQLRPIFIFVVIATALLFELRAMPLRLIRGKADPDQITLRLKQTSMRGGIVELPHDLGRSLPHRYMLRAADHEKPLVNATSSFVSPLTWEIQSATQDGPIPSNFIDLLEGIPTSYLVIHTGEITSERRLDYEAFIAQAIFDGRLRFINRFDGRDDLYAVVKNEPQAKTEAPLPFALGIKDWATLLNEDPVNVIGHYSKWSQKLYRVYLVSFGGLPRYAGFLSDLKVLGRGVLPNSADDETRLQANLDKLTLDWLERENFRAIYQSLTNERFVDALSEHAGITLAPAERADLIEKLDGGGLTRAQALIAIVDNQELVKKEENRSLILLHYFGYLRRNPDDPPDNNLNGFNYWLKDLEKSGDIGRLPRAFMSSIERERIEQK
ncbi:MAG TPA: hypothetical protein DC047_10095 [Blastocatellia bacterium]|nr:hypothetical protein [Blastocatellia bacterium]